MARERFQLDIVGEVVGMMSVGDFSGAFSPLTLMFVAREVRAAGAGAKRAAR